MRRNTKNANEWGTPSYYGPRSGEVARPRAAEGETPSRQPAGSALQFSCLRHRSYQK